MTETTTHTIRTRSTATHAIVEAHPELDVRIIGYAHTAEAADKRVRRERTKRTGITGLMTRHPIVAARIVAGAVTVELPVHRGS